MESFVRPLDVIRVLNEVGAKFILVGAYGVSGWMGKPRSTQDVDVIVAARDQKKSLKALEAAFPHLASEDHTVVTRFRDRETKEVRIDVMKPNQELFRDAFRHTKWVEAEGQRYRIPSLEMALAMKFAPMISLNRADADKLTDARDFIYIVNSNTNIDLDKLTQLGDLVYPGGGKEVVEHVRRVRAGEKLLL
jgi:predicted nucleotidyltransferase